MLQASGCLLLLFATQTAAVEATPMKEFGNSLLLVTHVAVRDGPNGPQIDDQTAAGISQWCRYFDNVTYCGIADQSTASSSTTTWVDIATVKGAERCNLLAFPRAYRLGRMMKEIRQVRAALRQMIRSHHHLCFTIGGLIGDWPAIAALESIRQKRRYAAWIDRVEPAIIRNKLQAGASLPKRIAAAVLLPTMERYTQHLLRSSTSALLQGRDTFDHYARWARDPHCTYDTHTHVSDQVTAEALMSKKSRVEAGFPLRVLYVGRAAAMKGPSDWLNVLERLDQIGVPIQATWIGDGPELAQMRARVSASTLSKSVHLPGFEGDRSVLLGEMQRSDLLLYCHKTPESPRCLVEALVSGCPIVGYDSAYPRGLVESRGGGIFTQQDDVGALVDTLVDLHRTRPKLSSLISAAAASGELYNEDAVYAHRALLMSRA